jgi:hypothetical protein
MARVTGSDVQLRSMLRIVNAPDDADNGEPLPRSVLAALASLVRADMVYFMRLEVERRETPLYQEYGQLPGLDDEDAPVEVFWSNYWTEPFCSYPDRTGDLTSVTKVSDFCTMPALRRTQLWSDYFRPFGTHRELMLCLPSPPRRTLRLLLVRVPAPDQDWIGGPGRLGRPLRERRGRGGGARAHGGGDQRTDHHGPPSVSSHVPLHRSMATAPVATSDTAGRRRCRGIRRTTYHPGPSATVPDSRSPTAAIPARMVRSVRLPNPSTRHAGVVRPPEVIGLRP